MSKKYQFEKLTLKDDLNIDVYEEALDYVFESDDIRNVAISGAYGAGKSSVLASYKKKHPDKKYIHISLAHFNSEKKIKDDEEDKGEEGVSESVLEGKILNQLIHQISSDNIPQTNFKVKKNINKREIVKSTFLYLTMLMCIGFLCFFDEWEEFVKLFSSDWLVGKVLNFTLNRYALLLAGVIILMIAYVFVYSVIKLQKNKNLFKRLNVQGNEIEIFENQDDSFFDKYLNEVLYLFENSQTDVIVFEDMDRFKIDHIFERLREINTLVNIQLAKKNTPQNLKKDEKFVENKKILRFFYLLRDDVFVSKDRTKFFDYIIPIVPVVDGTNSYNQFIEHLDKNNLTEKFEKKFLQDISLYIDDMRLLKNICNEFLVYYHRLNTIELNYNKMFAMITYKNLFPRDFSDLHNGQGYVKSLFEHKDEFILSERENIVILIENKKKEIDDCKNEQLVDIKELDIIKKNMEQSANVPSYNERSRKMREYNEWCENVYPVRKNAIQNKLGGRLPLIENELIDLELQLAKLGSRQLKDIINRENRNKIFRTPTVNEVGDKNEYKEIRGNDYFPLLKYLVGEGYIDETYADYMTYFYPNNLSLIDKIFIRSIRDKQSKEYSYSLKNPALILSYLNIADFEEPETLNFDLFDHILNNNHEYVEYFIVQLKKRRKFDFLSQFFTNRNIKNFIDKIIRYWPEFFFDVISESSMPYNQIREISLNILLHCDDNAIELANINNCLTEFVSKTNDYLNLNDFDPDRLISSFELINVKFKSINYDVSEINIYKLVYEKSMYCLTYENIKNMLNHIHGIQDEAAVRNKNYEVLLSIIDSPMYNYVKANIIEYFEMIFDECDGKIEDDEATIINVLNDEFITYEIKKFYITLLSNVVSDISQVTNHELWNVLLEQEKLSFSENNLCYCFLEYKELTTLLVDYINRYNGIIDISNISIETDEQFKHNIFNATIECYDLDDSKYGQILSSCNLVYKSTFNLNDVPISKMNVLIDNQIIKMTKGCLTSIRNNYETVLFSFIKRNISEYVDMMSADVFDYDELVEILSWNIEDEYKITLLEFTNEKISVVSKNYSDKVLSVILKNHFVLEDLPHLLKVYDSYSNEIKTIIFELSVKNYNRVLECSPNLSELFSKELLSCDKIDENKKIELFITLLEAVSAEQAKKFAFILNRTDLATALDPSKRPKIQYNQQNKKILELYKKRNWINDYSANNDNSYYTIKRSKVSS
ncbi:MAG: hypothetical protein IJX78_02105 [Bacilli bacterium]|nr:hypothetical protein [Bacilli bacterium]